MVRPLYGERLRTHGKSRSFAPQAGTGISDGISTDNETRDWRNRFGASLRCLERWEWEAFPAVKPVYVRLEDLHPEVVDTTWIREREKMA